MSKDKEKLPPIKLPVKNGNIGTGKDKRTTQVDTTKTEKR